jgi:RHS repeat-associated protein
LLWWESSANWARRSFHADHHGSIIAIADDGAGTPVAANGYDPWGLPNAENQGRFGYTGQVWIPELGLWYYKARFYSPTMGRFLQVDPVGYKDQVSLYAYVGNDPVDGRDPTGEMGCGTRLNYNSAGCLDNTGTMPGPSGNSGSRKQIAYAPRSYRGGPGATMVPHLLSVPLVRKFINEAWRRSHASGPTSGKNGWGFWVRIVGSKLIVGPLIEGHGPLVLRGDIEAERIPGAQIFIHVHPFDINEQPSGFKPITSLGLSDGDRGIGQAFSAMVISVSRKDGSPYVDYADEFYKR